MIHDVHYTNHPLSHTLTFLVFPVGGDSLVKQFKQMTLKRKLNGCFWERSCSLLGKQWRKDCLICLSPLLLLAMRRDVISKAEAASLWADGSKWTHKGKQIKTCRDHADTAELPDQPWDNLPLNFSELCKQLMVKPLAGGFLLITTENSPEFGKKKKFCGMYDCLQSCSAQSHSHYTHTLFILTCN